MNQCKCSTDAAHYFLSGAYLISLADDWCKSVYSSEPHHGNGRFFCVHKQIFVCMERYIHAHFLYANYLPPSHPALYHAYSISYMYKEIKLFFAHVCATTYSVTRGKCVGLEDSAWMEDLTGPSLTREPAHPTVVGGSAVVTYYINRKMNI